jgi:Arc/MetJ family transcription regulator
MNNGQSVANGGAGMSGLLSQTACQFAGALLDTAASTVHEALTDRTKLSAAADHYHRMDEEFGRRLRKFAP